MYPIPVSMPISQKPKFPKPTPIRLVRENGKDVLNDEIYKCCNNCYNKKCYIRFVIGAVKIMPKGKHSKRITINNFYCGLWRKENC